MLIYYLSSLKQLYQQLESTLHVLEYTESSNMYVEKPRSIAPTVESLRVNLSDLQRYIQEVELSDAYQKEYKQNYI